MSAEDLTKVSENEIERFLLEYLESKNEPVTIQNLILDLMKANQIQRNEVESALRSLSDLGKVEFDSHFEVSSSDLHAA